MKASEVREGMSIIESGVSYEITMIYRGGRGTYSFVTDGGVFIFRGSQNVDIA